MMVVTRENVVSEAMVCDDEGSTPDVHENGVGDGTAPRVGVTLIDHGRFVVDALDLF